MNSVFNSRYSGIPSSLCNKINSLISYFEKPLPSFKFSLKDLSEINDMLSNCLQEHNLKAQKLIQITQTFQQLIENYSKSLSYLETFKVEAELKIEELESKVELLLKSEENYEKRLESLNFYIEDLEKNQDSVINERNSLKIELNQIKTDSKLSQSRLESDLNEERSKLLSLKLTTSKNFEKLKNELFFKEKTLKDYEEKIDMAEKKTKAQKDLNEKLREDFNKLKNETFEMKNKLSESRLKKENYKQLYKELISFNSNKATRSIAIQTFDELGVCWEGEEVNDLLELEEEQSLASSLNIFNVEVADESSMSEILQVSKKENTFYFIASKTEEKLKTETFSMFFPSKPRKTFTVSIQQSLKLNPKKTLPKSLKMRPSRSSKYLKIHSFNSTVLSPESQPELLKNPVLNPKKRPAGRFLIETWISSIQVSMKSLEFPALENRAALDQESESHLIEEDSFKTSIIKFCPVFKPICPLSDGIQKLQPKDLLAKLRDPLCGLSETIHLFIQDHLSLFRDV